MAEACDIPGIIYQNLQDAGCDKQTIEECMTFVKDGKYRELLPILLRHRIDLIGSIRAGQKKIDCLDYLIYKIKNDSI